MNGESDFRSTASTICQYILGFDAENPDAAPVKVTKRALREAIKEAYIAGQKEKLLQESGVDTELLFWQLMDSLPDNVYFKDLRSRFICINIAQARFLGLTDPNDAIGKSDFDFFDEEKALERFNGEQEIIRTGQGWSLQEEKDLEMDNEQACIISSKLPLKDPEGKTIGTFGISRDVTSRYLAEREVERQRNLMEAIIQILPCRVFVRDIEDRFILVNEAYRAAIAAPSRESIIGKRLSELQPTGRHGKIQEEDEIVKKEKRSILNKIDYDRDPDGEKRWLVTSKVPLEISDGVVEGIVGMTYDITEQKKAEEEARALSHELQEKNEQFEAELLVARQLQETLMSIGFDQQRVYRQQGASWNIDASYFYKPSHHLAGDFFDLIPISENRLGILVCDVMGHGVKAALVTMLLRGLVLELPKLLAEPSALLSNINKSLCSLAEDQEFPRFVTAVYMMIDLEKGTACVSNAGHTQPLWRTRDDSGAEHFAPCPSGRSGPALGLIENETYDEREFSFNDVTEILFYTDGIIEQTDAMGKPFGLEKLEEILLNNEPQTLTTQLRTLNSALRLTAGSSAFDDDICLVAAQLTPRENR